jgi:uncharacterized OB-fold protein
MNRLHLNLTHGETQDAKCLKCGTVTVLVTAADWKTHPEEDDDQEFVELADEISGHYCPECHKITALFFNEGP